MIRLLLFVAVLLALPGTAWAKERELPKRDGATFRARWARGEVL